MLLNEVFVALLFGTKIDDDLIDLFPQILLIFPFHRRKRKSSDEKGLKFPFR
jgi:hypothetical protein